MDNTKHTPGPWEVAGATLIWSPKAAATIGAASELRASQFVRFTDVNCTSPDLQEIGANARLMAAAPELLKLVRQYATADSLSDITNATNDARPVLDRLCPGWDQPAE